MGLRPTQEYEKRLGSASTLHGTVTLSLSSRPKRSGAEGPAVPRTHRGDVFRQCEAQWRDLRFFSLDANPKLEPLLAPTGSRFGPILTHRPVHNRIQ
jgi:hypothetical protein